MNVVAVSDVAALIAALKSAQAGDVIALAPGRYDDVLINKLNFAGPGVTITSQDRGAPAEIVGLDVRDSSGINFRGLSLVSEPGDAHPSVVTGCERIVLDQLYVHGSLNDDPTDDVGGLQVRSSVDVSITNSTFEQLRWGVSHLDTTRLTISDNEFHDLRVDGIRGGGSSFITIVRNSFRDFFIKTDDHGDVIQFWTTNTTASAHDILIADNVFVRGDGYYVQGICLRDEDGALPYERVVIRGNLLAGSTYNALTVGNSRDVTVEGNVVQAFADRDSFIRMTHVDGLTFTDNSAMRIHINDSTNVTETGTVKLAVTTDAGAAALESWLAARMATLVGTPADDVLLGSPTGSNLRGAEGNDVLRGSAGFDDINGNQGDDTASGGSGDDWVVGGKDNDRLSGDAGNDLVYGNLGSDTCEGGAGADTLRGGQQDDVLLGGAGNDYLSGDRDNDTLTGGAGADVFHAFGEAGLDLITDFNAAEGDRIVLDPGTTYSVFQSGADTVVSMLGGGRVILAGVSLSTLGEGWITVG